METTVTQRKKIRLSTLQKMHREGEPIAMLTAYDSTFAYQEDQAGVDIILIGDSLGMTIQGHDSTVPVTIEDMVYHTKCVAAGNKNCFVMADLPFGSYHVSDDQAVANCVALMQAGANMVKIEGGVELAPLFRRLTNAGIPVCAHLGFTPQSINTIGGFFVQGKTDAGKDKLKKEALTLQDAGAAMVLFEMVPASIAREITSMLFVPTIGIGAGVGCSGQVLVMQDILGIFPGHLPKFSRNFMEGSASIQEAIKRYVGAVKDKSFPTDEHSF